MYAYIHGFILLNFVDQNNVLHVHKYTHVKTQTTHIYIHAYIHSYIYRHLFGMQEKPMTMYMYLKLTYIYAYIHTYIRRRCYAGKQNDNSHVRNMYIHIYIHTYIHT
jgi:hypothetical protein